jgi:hypothetical protein
MVYAVAEHGQAGRRRLSFGQVAVALSPSILPSSAFQTSDCDKPNCRAICDGLTPALKAARTAFTLPAPKWGRPASIRGSTGVWMADFPFGEHDPISAEAINGAHRSLRMSTD